MIALDFSPLLSGLDALCDCAMCPRSCHANRFTRKKGYCRAGTGFNIAAICIHQGEEPVVSGSRGICNIFFTHCNLQCIYCQNHQISQNILNQDANELALNEVIRQITRILDTGINAVGFVSPSHYVPQVQIIMQAIKQAGYSPTWVYNSNGYDAVKTLRLLEGKIDFYLPDFKYMDSALAATLSNAPDYPAVASAAIREMYRQKGSSLIVNDEGYATSGMLVRHLVLPGAIENSLRVLQFLALEISQRVPISLMAQYYPAFQADNFPNLNRCITIEEYHRVLQEMERLGLDRGFIQELESFDHYRPDFNKMHPFESD